MSEFKIKILKKAGMSDDDINLYGTDFLIQYLKYHKQKKIGVFFLGFDKDELVKVKNIAILYNLLIFNGFSDSTDIFCVKDGFNVGAKTLEVQNDVIVLSESEFLEIFKFEKDYLIKNNGNIYPYSVKEEFRIVKPLSNFDVIRKIESYSLDECFEENYKSLEYSVNLYRGTCTCNDYTLNNRGQFVNGDLRRYCKHLKSLYKTSFSPRELKGINKFFVSEKFYLKQNIDKINIQSIDKTIYVAYNSGEEDCDFYFPAENDAFEHYSYNYETKYFYDKPYGYATILRKELDNYFRFKRKFHIEKAKPKQKKYNTKQEDQNVNNVTGCLIFIIIIFSILYSLF